MITSINTLRYLGNYNMYNVACFGWLSHSVINCRHFYSASSSGLFRSARYI